jgi:4-phytase/acid phosphatase
MRTVLIGLIVAVTAASLSWTAHAEPVLERVVLVARHGVRAPTASPEALQSLTGQAWPAWPVGPGELTSHGAEALGRMADFVRAVYAREGLLPQAACPAPGVVQVWADGADRRTRESGAVWARALDCGRPAGHGPDGERDALFDAAGMGVCPIDLKAGTAAISAVTRDGADLVRAQDQASLGALQAVVAPDGCGRGPGPCFEAPSELAAGASALKLTGPLAVGSSLSENLLLEYAQGLPLDQVGWGRLGASETEVERSLAAILPVHERAATLMRQTPYLARHNGAILAGAVLDLLQAKAPRDTHAPPLSAAARLTVFAGHDTNLSNLAGVFGLNWTLPDQPDATAPDTTLAFEVWRDGAAETVRVVIYSQSLRALRTASELDQNHPASVTPVALPDCAGGACTLATLAAAVTRRLPQDCRR